MSCVCSNAVILLCKKLHCRDQKLTYAMIAALFKGTLASLLMYMNGPRERRKFSRQLVL